MISLILLRDPWRDQVASGERLKRGGQTQRVRLQVIHTVTESHRVGSLFVYRVFAVRKDRLFRSRLSRRCA